MGEFSEVYHHRLRYFLTPQFDMYRIIREKIVDPAAMIRAGSGVGILDYGCGNGVGSVLLDGPYRTIVGVDSDEEAIAFAADSWGHLADFCHADWTEVEPSEFAYEVVVCLEVIEHVADPRLLLERLAKKSTETCVISTLNHNSQYRKNRGHVGKFCIEDFRSLVGEFFPGVKIYDYTLENELDDGSSITPMVAVWSNEDWRGRP